MRFAKNALLLVLTMLSLLCVVSAQSTLRSPDDDRNPAPTVGTGGPVGGPTGLFTVYDGQTLRRGEFTFSVAYSNFDRDPGNVDIVEIPVSFQVGLSDRAELFFNTDAYRQIKVNNPRNLSSFSLPNSRINGVSPGAIVLSPLGPGTPTFQGAVFRPAGTQPFAAFPFTGGSAGNFGFSGAGSTFTIGPQFGFTGNTITLGPPRDGGGSGRTADLFPGVGSVFGGILPGLVLSTQQVGTSPATIPLLYTSAPSYLPDAPFINRRFGESSFNTFVVGGKFRFTSPASSVGVGLIPFYRFYADNADDASGFNQMQRGSGPGAGGFNPISSNRGDVGLTLFADARLRRWLNLSGNVGYVYNSSVKADIGGTEFTLLDRGDEFHYGVALDFPVNQHFQPILEFQQTRYVGGRTPNVFENDPMNGIAGFRVFPARWFGFSAAYRVHLNQQDRESFQDVTFSNNVQGTTRVLNAAGTTTGVTLATPTTATGSILNNGFTPSSDPHGFIFGIFAGHRNARGQRDIPNQPANVTAVTLDRTSLVLPCAQGTSSASGGCGDVQTVGVRTTAVDPEGDVLTYSYTVSGGRITGQGANVTWDLSGVRPGTYTITSAVDDGCGFCGTPQTTTINVVDCPDCRAPDVVRCECATITASGPSGTTAPGSPMTFTANVSGGTGQGDPTYNWTVSAGTIESGQGTPSITVSTAGLSNQTVSATVTVGNTADCPCPKDASAEGIIGTNPESRLIEEFEAAVPDVIKARLDNFYSALASDPNARGVIINYGTDREVARRERDIRSAIAFRQYDINRVTFVRGGSTPGIRTQFYLVPAGAQEPTPQE